MNSLKQFFSYMNDIDFPYVVLRNWEKLPYDISLGEHSDLDLLVYDYSHWKEIFPKAVSEYPYPRVRHKLSIDDSFIYVDVRHIGDGYYPEDFEKAILETREWNEKGFWTPNPVHHRIALAYHIVHHKNYLSPSYYRFVGKASIDDMLDSLKESTIGWTKPNDKSVGAYNAYWKGATSVVSRDNNRISKRQMSYCGYPLISNEFRILTRISSIHFPKAFECDGERLVIEDCGSPILEDLPKNWITQLSDILDDLESNAVIHRDIRLDNLLVKDGTIKLIDFGWAKFIGEEDAKEPPSCLGYPNKPSWGFDDAFSMNSVIRQIKFEIEERDSIENLRD